MATIHDAVAAQIKRAKDIPEDADHYRIASNYADLARLAAGVSPVFSLGAFWTYDPKSGLWIGQTLDAVAADVGAKYPGYKLVKRGSDYRQIAALVATIAADDRFFSDAPPGIAAAGEFWCVSSSGEILREKLGAAHRQRMQTAVAPVFNGEAPLFGRLLDNAFGSGDTGDEQRELLQMALGAALTGHLWRHRAVLMMYGATSTGKSTLLEIFKSFVTPDLIGATSPQNWASEYYVAALAGKRLNLVGELDPHIPIPGGPFKAVTGGDVVEGRHPTHRPFSFVCDAAHIFNCNRLPPTRDKSDAFFRRWRIVEFSNPVPVGQEITGLAERIIANEQGDVLGWLLEGAARLVRRGSLPTTPTHGRLIEMWRAANNTALQFLLDAEACALTPRHELKAADVFDAYRRWANASGIKPLGRNTFYEAVQDGAGRIGVSIYTNSATNVRMLSGVSLNQ